jgi:hypothetical protein
VDIKQGKYSQTFAYCHLLVPDALQLKGMLRIENHPPDSTSSNPFSFQSTSPSPLAEGCRLQVRLTLHHSILTIGEWFPVNCS